MAGANRPGIGCEPTPRRAPDDEPHDQAGRTQERQVERQLIADYTAMIETQCAAFDAGKIATLARLARLPETIRGYGHIKEANIEKYRIERARLEADLQTNRRTEAAA